MSKLSEYRDRVRVSCYFKPNTKMNVVKFNSNNSWLHEISKAMVAFYILKEKNHDFLCEPEFLDKSLGRPDVVDLQAGIAYEVVESESDESIEEKRKKYPFTVVKVDAISFALERVLAYFKDKLS